MSTEEKENTELINEEDDEEEGPTEVDSTQEYTPVVKLEAVEYKTMEEDEEVLYKQRAKLYIFGETMLDKGTGIKQWKERGLGDVKLLKHKDTGRIRVLMRQEKTMKLIINHFLDPRIKLVVNQTNEKSWVWNAFDFSEGELIETTFALRFGSVEIAQEFKSNFEKGQEEMKAHLAAEAKTAETEEKKEEEVKKEEEDKEADKLAEELSKVEVKDA